MKLNFTLEKKRIVPLFLVLLFTSFSKSSNAQTILEAGDVAIVGINSANPDRFSFVLLKNIEANTVINFTDNGFTGTNTTGRTGEGFLTYTAPSAQTAGTVLTWFNGMTIGTSGWNSNAPSNFAFNAGGDQLFAFQGNTANWATQSGITLLFGINYGIALSSTSNASNTLQPSTTILPAANFLNLPSTNNANGYFANGTTSASIVTVSGTPTSLMTLFSDATKWYGSSATGATFPTFSITVQWPVTATAGANGTIAPAGVTNVNNGANRAYTITPNSGYNVADVLVDNVSVGAVTTYTFTNVTKAHTIEANFSSSAPTPSVNLSVSANAGSEANTTAITVTATASSAVSGAQTVSLSVSGTNITTTDYSLSNTTITIADGATTGAVTFTIANDALVEGTETAVLTISNPSAGLILGATTTQNIVITDNGYIRITEFQYNGSEFIEFSNVGGTAVDMTGWSFSDNARQPGAVNLSAYGIVQPGESVILTEEEEVDFRTRWTLCNLVKIIGGNGVNLGRSDEINIYDNNNTLIDRLTYNDQAGLGPRTDNASAWPSAAALGTNNAALWTKSTNADAEGSYTSVPAAYFASPGKSTRITTPHTTCPPGAMRITEVIYSGSTTAEFIEFTNVGSTAVNMNGWSYDDNSRTAGVVDLSAFGTVQPGESVILCETDATAFRAAWNLCPAIKVIGNNAANLGRNDEINLYDAAEVLVDRLTYNDEGTGNVAGPRTNGASAWPPAGAVAANNFSLWTLATTADAEGSYASTSGDIGSPGKSTRVVYTYIPNCAPPAGAPTIAINVATTTDLLDAGMPSSPVSPYAISGVINDVIDPAKTNGIDFILNDDVTSVADLTVTVSSSNTAVVPNNTTNLALTTISGAIRNLKIIPTGVGFATITVTVSDGTLNSAYIINYAASNAASGSSSWLTGISDASTAIALDDDYMLVGNDETNQLYLYLRNQSGLPVKTFEFNAGNSILALPDGNSKEVDIEAAVKSPAIPGRIYFMGSLSNSSNSPFEYKPNRDRLFAVTVSGTGAATTVTPVNGYTQLRDQLITWGNSNGYNFTARATGDPKRVDGFNVEGMVFAPDQSTMYIGFRAPLVPAGGSGPRVNALIAPLQNFETALGFRTNASFTIGAPIELNLGGRGIREMIRLTNGHYIIVAGSADTDADAAVYKWSGNPVDAPVALPSFNIAALNAEGVMQVNQAGSIDENKLQFISDNGDNIYYGGTTVAKDLAQNNFKKFQADVVTSSLGGVLPVKFEYFTAARQNSSSVLLKWKISLADPAERFEILRSVNGADYAVIGTVAGADQQSEYSYTDVVGNSSNRLYYKIKAVEHDGYLTYTGVRFVDFTATGTLLTVYPNPVQNNSFTISVNKPGTKSVIIYNTGGAAVATYTFGENVKDINTTGWAKGYYWLRIISNDGTVFSEKLAVQ